MQQDIETAVIKAIATQKHLDTNTLNSESVLQDIGVSSLDAITIVYEIEELFDITVPNDQLDGLRTVGDIAKKVEELQAQKSMS